MGGGLLQSLRRDRIPLLQDLEHAEKELQSPQAPSAIAKAFLKESKNTAPNKR